MKAYKSDLHVWSVCVCEVCVHWHMCDYAGPCVCVHEQVVNYQCMSGSMHVILFVCVLRASMCMRVSVCVYCISVRAGIFVREERLFSLSLCN